MKKITLTLITRFVVIIVSGLLFNACKPVKPEKTHPFFVNLKTWYRVSPLAPAPVVVNGISYVSQVNLVVGGQGSAGIIGNVKSFANTVAYGTEPEGPSLGAIGAPAVEIAGYPLLGGPLPLIQPGDFAALPRVIANLNIPSRVNGHAISLVLYNNKGDAIFIATLPGTGTATFISPVIGGYTNKAIIAGGAGRFKYASGELYNEGYFTFEAPYDGEDKYDGWISY